MAIIWTSRNIPGYISWNNPAWSGFMNSYASHPFNTSVNANGLSASGSTTQTAPYSGTHTLRGAADNFGSISMGGQSTSTGGFRGSGNTVSRFYNRGDRINISWSFGNQSDGSEDFNGNPCAIAITLTAPDAPPRPSVNLSASPSRVCPGNTTQVSWSYSGSFITSAVLTGPGINQNVGSSGSIIGPAGQYTLRVTNEGGTSQTTRNVTQLENTEVNFTNTGSNVIIFPNSFTLQWASSGSNNDTTINQGVGDVNNSGSVTVNPSSTTTYTVTSTGTCSTDTDTYTVEVYYPPEVTNNTTTEVVDYGNQFDIQYDYAYTDISAQIDFTYTYRDGTTLTDTVNLPTTTVLGDASSTTTTSIPYNDEGPFAVEYRFVGEGSGGSVGLTSNILVFVDLLPTAINIPPTNERLKGENPVFSPIDIINSSAYDITDVDIPVEIKSDKPIKVSRDGGETFQDIKEI